MTTVVVELGSPGRPPVRHALDRPTVVGREGDLAVDDERASRRHAVLEPVADGLRIDDLGSANGTFVNGARIDRARTVGVGDVITVGLSTLRIVGVGALDARDASVPPAGPGAMAPPVAPAPTVPPPAPPVAAAPAAALAAPAGAPAAARPDLAALEGRSSGGVHVRFRPGTAGEREAAGVLAAAAEVRRRLAGFGNESWGVPVQVCLVDPFPDPEHPSQWISEGTVVDPVAGEVWMVVTDQAAPEPVGRALALVFGNPFPAHRELAPYLEGYGLLLGGADDPTPELRGRKLPPSASADGDLAGAMAVGFVGFLVQRGGDEALRRFFATARPGALDDAASAVWGASLAALDGEWRASLQGSGTAVKAGAFLHLSASYLRPHLRRQIEVFVYLLASLAFSTALPFVTKRLLDTALPSGRWSEVATLLAVLAGAFVVSILAQVRQRYLSAFMSSAVVRSIRDKMFDRLQELSAGWYSRHDQGDVLSRFFSDVTMLEMGLSTLLRDGVFQIVSLLVALVVCFTLDWRLAIVVSIGAPVIGIVYRRMSDGALTRSMAMQEESGNLMSVAAENFQAHQVVKAFSLRAREVTRFNTAAGRLFDAEMKMSLFGGWFMLSVQLIVTVLRLGVMGLGGWLIIRGELSIGAYVAFLGVMGQVLEPVAGLTSMGQELQQSMGALARVQEVMDAVPEVRDVAQPRPLARLARELRFEGVAFGYTPERRVLDGVDLVVPAGTRTAVVGPSGSGKSSLLQLLLRSYDPDEGRITWDGVDLTQARLDDLRAHTGVVFQDTFAFDDTIRENIRVGRLDASDAEVEAAARQAELHDFVVGTPNGYDTVVGERGGLLSGGQRQRLAIARALLRDPSLLVLDEATSALDARTERVIAGTLDRASRGRTTIAVTHRLGTVTGYDQIVVVVDGRIVERGTHAELLAAAGAYAGLWAEQGEAVAAPPAGATPVGPGAGRHLGRMTGVLRPLPVPPPAPVEPPVRATGTFGPVR